MYGHDLPGSLPNELTLSALPGLLFELIASAGALAFVIRRIESLEKKAFPIFFC